MIYDALSILYTVAICGGSVAVYTIYRLGKDVYSITKDWEQLRKDVEETYSKSQAELKNMNKELTDKLGGNY